MNHNLLNYLTNKAHLFNFAEEKDDSEREKTLKKIFDKSDLLSDKERQDSLFVFNNMEYISKHKQL